MSVRPKLLLNTTRDSDVLSLRSTRIWPTPMSRQPLVPSASAPQRKTLHFACRTHAKMNRRQCTMLREVTRWALLTWKSKLSPAASLSAGLSSSAAGVLGLASDEEEEAEAAPAAPASAAGAAEKENPALGAVSPPVASRLLKMPPGASVLAGGAPNKPPAPAELDVDGAPNRLLLAVAAASSVLLAAGAPNRFPMAASLLLLSAPLLDEVEGAPNKPTAALALMSALDEEEEEDDDEDDEVAVALPPNRSDPLLAPPEVPNTLATGWLLRSRLRALSLSSWLLLLLLLRAVR